MSIIDHLEQTVTPAVLGDQSSVSHVSLLEQFYAMLVARLALPQVYSQLLRDDQVITSDNAVQTPLFEQLWQAPNARRTMIQELAATHHIDEFATMQLLMNAAPLVYHELKVLADGQFLPAFLQGAQPSLRHYLPIWSVSIITASQSPNDELFESQGVMASAAAAPVIPVSLNKYEAAAADIINPPANMTVESPIPTLDERLSADSIHVSPAEHHLAENNDLRREKVRTRNQRNDLLLWTFVLLGAITAIGLVWALLIRPNNAPPVETVVTAPVVVPAPAAPAQVLTPIELIVGVDNNGSLYMCSGLVGDAGLQSTLQQALNTSFGEQASMCQLTVQTGVANSVANMPIEALPNVLTLLRSTPFARLHLQNDRITLEAPDSMQLQRLVTDIRTLIPAMMIDSTAPIPLPDNVNGDNNGNNGIGDEAATNNANSANNQFQNDGIPTNNSYENSNNVEYQASDDDTNDNVIPAPARNNNDFNNSPARSNGPISESEVDDMASNVFIVEPAQVRR